MKLAGYLEQELVISGVEPSDKPGMLSLLLEVVERKHSVGDNKKVLKELIIRERQSSTGIGAGIAVPHAIVESLPHTVLAVATIPKGMDFHSVDNYPVRVVFLLLSPPGRAREHIKLLARISRICSSPSLVQQIAETSDEKEILSLITAEDDRHIG
jgi:mannitol/fructose-specific phosphotransferase system IIA component (Ntr-type)